MIMTAHAYVRGEVHFSYLLAEVEECGTWGKVHNVHPKILELCEQWREIGGHVWPCMSQKERWPESRLYEQVRADLGLS